MTQYTPKTFAFGQTASRQILARFDGGHLSSFGGIGLLRLTEQITQIVAQAAMCFVDHRDPKLIRYPVGTLLSQRLMALALGYEDVNDHDQLRHDPAMTVACGATSAWLDDDQQGPALAGKSTLNRMELTPIRASAKSRYKKIVLDRHAMEKLLVDLYLQAQQRQTPKPPKQIVLDLDATDTQLHGQQPGRFYHGYYRHYCYLPLYIFCGDHLLVAKLRPANIDAARGAVKEVSRVVEQIRSKWPDVPIILRADSGFCRENLMNWCETNQVDYVFGLARNHRLEGIVRKPMNKTMRRCQATGQACRLFKTFGYKTRKTWSTKRRVIAKAEALPAHGSSMKRNLRLIVTNLSKEAYGCGQQLYETFYCQRGEAENRIKEQQLYLFADRLSTSSFRGNQLRLFYSALAYTLMRSMIRLALHGTQWCHAQPSMIRQRLLCISSKIRITSRRIWISLSSSCPDQSLFARAYEQLHRWVT